MDIKEQSQSKILKISTPITWNECVLKIISQNLL